MPQSTLPDWERVLSSAAHLQRILPDAVLVGGTASALYASHRISTDADHVIGDLRSRFDTILAELEAVAGWKDRQNQAARPSFSAVSMASKPEYGSSSANRRRENG